MTLERAERFVWQNARLLEQVVWQHLIKEPTPDRVVRALEAYRSNDGGLGYGLEPDVCAPTSQPLFVEFGLDTLTRCGIRATGLTGALCDFLARHADMAAGIPTLLPTARDYPHAPHWEGDGPYARSLDRLIGLVGLANWQGAVHPWLMEAVPACLEHLATLEISDAHGLRHAFCLLESVAPHADVDSLFARLAGLLERADFFLADAPVTGYGLTPLDFAPTPDAYTRPLFGDGQIAAHLDDLAAQQEADGGWPIAWQPPSEAARWAWRAHRTVYAVATLRAYGRV